MGVQMITLNGAYREVNNLLNPKQTRGLTRAALRDIHFRLHRAWGEGDYIPPTDSDLDNLKNDIDNLDKLWPTTPAPG